MSIASSSGIVVRRAQRASSAVAERHTIQAPTSSLTRSRRARRSRAPRQPSAGARGGRGKGGRSKRRAGRPEGRRRGRRPHPEPARARAARPARGCATSFPQSTVARRRAAARVQANTSVPSASTATSTSPTHSTAWPISSPAEPLPWPPTVRDDAPVGDVRKNSAQLVLNPNLMGLVTRSLCPRLDRTAHSVGGSAPWPRAPAH